jgi:hypothetical protein
VNDRHRMRLDSSTALAYAIHRDKLCEIIAPHKH